MTQRSYTLCLLALCLLFSGCSSLKKTIGIDRDPPDEYRVTPSPQPLEMPPDFHVLPTPMPGAERPQDVAVRQTQEAQFLGAPVVETQPLSPAQSAVLDMCGVEKGQENIRYEVDREARIEGTKDKPILQRLGIQSEKPKGEAVDPYAESEELYKKGLPAGPRARREALSPAAIKASGKPEVKAAPELKPEVEPEPELEGFAG